jgi:hypothetical protein
MGMWDSPEPLSASPRQTTTYAKTLDPASLSALLVGHGRCRLLGVVWHHLQPNFSTPFAQPRLLVGAVVLAEPCVAFWKVGGRYFCKLTDIMNRSR